MTKTLVLHGSKLFCFLIFFTLKSVNSQVYFCYNGPQKINASECKEGIIFLKQIESRCLAVVKEDKVEMMTIKPKASACEAESEDSIDPITLEGGAPSLRQDITFQEIKRSFIGEATEFGTEKTGGKDPVSICLTECLAEWVDPRIAIEDDPPYDYGFVAPTTEVTTQQEKLSLDLFTYMTFDYSPETETNSKADLRILDVFHEALLTLEKHCTPFLSKEFIQAIYYAHRFIVLRSGAELNDLGMREYRLILDGLRKCKDNPSKFVIKSEVCGDKENAKIQAINGVPHKLETKSYRWGTLDVLIEAAWNAVEFVHGYCYREYAHDITWQHFLVKAIDALFRQKVQERWVYPTKFRQDQYWNNMLGVKNVNLTMRNIDACIQAGRKFSPYAERLGRPIEKQPGTYQPTGYGINKGGNLPQVVRGFKGGLGEYWGQYKAIGGIKSAIQGQGFCAEDSVEFNDYLRVVNGHCPATSQSREYTDDDEEGDNDV